MKINFKTNIDFYHNDWFPSHLEQVPRIGDTVSILSQMHSLVLSKKMPTKLKVVDVTWTEFVVVCELHLSETQFQSLKLSGVDWTNP